MKVVTLAVLGGLCFAGNALAADPAPQQETPTAAGASLKIGIDPKTGKRRALTAAESAALDAKAMPRTASARTARTAAPSPASPPVTYEESAAAGVRKNGMTGYIAPLESYSQITVTRHADGKLVMQENGQPFAHAHEEEAASE